MNNRIKEIRKSNGLTLEKFGERIGVSRAAMSNIENGNRNVTEQMFKSICREFKVNEQWLRTGIGEMSEELDLESQMMRWAANVLKDDSESFRKRFVHMLMGLTEDEWDLLERKARELFDETIHKES